MSRHSIFKGSFSTSETELKAVWPAISLLRSQVMKSLSEKAAVCFHFPPRSPSSWKGEDSQTTRELLSCCSNYYSCRVSTRKGTRVVMNNRHLWPKGNVQTS